MRDLERFLASASGWIAPGTVVAALLGGTVAGLGPALLILAGGMLLGAVLLLWSSLGRLTGDSPLTLEEAVGLGAPSAEEERKRSILRALKDLEYERSVGKISEEDFAVLSARYRTEAKALLRALEADLAPRREKAEAKLRARLEKDSVAGEARAGGRSSSRPPKKGDSSRRPPRKGDSPARAIEGAPAEAPPGAPAEETPGALDGAACPACQTTNDSDARFCKRCGASLEATEHAS